MLYTFHPRETLLAVAALLCVEMSAVGLQAETPEILSPGTPLALNEEGFAPMFPFVISKVPLHNITNVTIWNPEPVRPAGSDGFVCVENGQFVNDAGVIHFFGTNLSCDASFADSHEDAEFLAKSIARFGINIVRIHYIDTAGRLFDRNQPQRELSVQNMEKLDYLIYQLEQNGIYVNLNLHVARQFRELDGFSGEKERPKNDKGLDNFEPRMIALQKEFARNYLKHVNPYTRRAYVNDPGVAMIEINNENSIVGAWRWGSLETLPAPYSETLQTLWNAWLRKKYDSTDALRKAWNCRFYPDGENLLPGGNLSSGENLSPSQEEKAGGKRIPNWEFVTEKAEWTYELTDGTSAGTSAGTSDGTTTEKTLHIQVQKAGEQSWAPQFHCVGASLKKDVPYKLTLKMRSRNASTVSVGVSQMNGPWNNLGFSQPLTLSNDWNEYTFEFCANSDEPRARVGFGGLKAGTDVEIASVSLREGGCVGASPEEKLENGTIQPVFYRRKNATHEQFCDMADFILETENAYWQTMYHFVKDELHAHAPVSGTQLRYGGWYAQAALDYCDIHAYWNHPSWLGKSWDLNNWFVRNTALVNHWATAAGTTNRLANARVLGLPLTVSEYNHPYPNFYGAEGLPEACAMGAFQNWSALYQYTWQHNTDYDQQKTNGFFDMTCNQAQLAHAPACWAMFCRGDVTRGPVRFLYSPDFSRKTESELFHTSGSGYHQELASDDPALPFVVNTGLNLTDLCPFSVPENMKIATSWNDLPAECGRPEKRWLRSETGELYYNWELEGKGFFTVNTPKTKIFTGFVADRTFEIGNVALKPGKTRLDWLTFSMTQTTSTRTLIAATGFIRNHNMKFEDLGNDRITCRTDWGTEPVECEGIPMEVRIRSVPPGRKCFALAPDGSRKEELPVRWEDDGCTMVFEISPKYQTLWYELVELTK